MTDSQKFDLIVVGGGPGGYVGAIRASQLGQKVAVVEKENLGGICLNWGCIPTKALLRAAELKHNVSNLSEFGIEIEGSININLKNVIARSRKVAERLSIGVSHLMKKNKITGRAANPPEYRTKGIGSKTPKSLRILDTATHA